MRVFLFWPFHGKNFDKATNVNNVTNLTIHVKYNTFNGFIFVLQITS
jgi:hypothetical protein